MDHDIAIEDWASLLETGEGDEAEGGEGARGELGKDVTDELGRDEASKRDSLSKDQDGKKAQSLSSTTELEKICEDRAYLRPLRLFLLLLLPLHLSFLALDSFLLLSYPSLDSLLLLSYLPLESILFGGETSGLWRHPGWSERR